MTQIARKVFCIGFQKTGTTSLRDAFIHLGYRYHGPVGRTMSLDQLQSGLLQRATAVAREHDVVADMPWPLLYREMDAAFPGSRFILTLRDTDSWLRSISEHFAGNPHALQQLTYGEDAPAPVGNEQRYREVYERHNREVQEYFADRPGDLLVMNLQNGDGWAELAAFLQIEGAPTGPFARANTGAARNLLWRRIRGRLRRLGMLPPRRTPVTQA